jgi:NodT family efflux transporter outer membrane factor (OMF) lipoprotein
MERSVGISMDGIRRVWLSAVTLLLSSCGIPQLHQPDAGPALPDSFNGATSGENSSQVAVDEFFNDEILTGLIEQGLAGNQQLKIIEQNVQIANNIILAKRGAFLPFVTIGGGAQLEKPSEFTPLGAVDDQLQYAPGENFPKPLPNFLAATNLSWQIDIWRQLRNARDAAMYRYLGTADGRNYVVTRLVADIAENYYHLMALDKRIENLDRVIALQERSLEVAEAKLDAGQGTSLAVQRFVAEVRKNQSEKLIIYQEIIETENRINYLLGRFPEPVPRNAENFFDLNLHALSLGVPSDLLQFRPDIRAAERELAAAGLDVKVARANFYPKLMITGGVGWEAFNTKYLFTTPDSLVYTIAGDMMAPLINKLAIKADYMNANARQLQACYEYQRVIINAFTEVINRVNKVQNYTRSIEFKKQELDALEASVVSASNLFQAARVDYMDVLFAQRDMMNARMDLIDTKKEQLGAIVNTYQALGGGLILNRYLASAYTSTDPLTPEPATAPPPPPPTEYFPTLVPPAIDAPTVPEGLPPSDEPRSPDTPPGLDHLDDSDKEKD